MGQKDGQNVNLQLAGLVGTTVEDAKISVGRVDWTEVGATASD